MYSFINLLFVCIHNPKKKIAQHVRNNRICNIEITWEDQTVVSTVYKLIYSPKSQQISVINETFISVFDLKQ